MEETIYYTPDSLCDIWAGTLDFIGTIKPKAQISWLPTPRRVLIDWKTSESVGFDNFIQVNAYRFAALKSGFEDAQPCIVRPREDGALPFFDFVKPEGYAPLFSVFGGLRNMYEVKKQFTSFKDICKFPKKIVPLQPVS